MCLPCTLSQAAQVAAAEGAAGVSLWVALLSGAGWLLAGVGAGAVEGARA